MSIEWTAEGSSERRRMKPQTMAKIQVNMCGRKQRVEDIIDQKRQEKLLMNEFECCKKKSSSLKEILG